MRVCMFCGREDPEGSAPYPLECEPEEHREWMASGKRPGAAEGDHMGERDLVPCVSPVEAAYRRGIAQALYRAVNMTRRERRLTASLAMEWRYDGQPHPAFLDQLSGVIRGK